MSGKEIRKLFFFALFQFITNGVLSEYKFTLERRIGESDIVTFKNATDANSNFLEGGGFMPLDTSNSTWCRNAIIQGKNQKRNTITKSNSKLSCMNQGEILRSSTYFEI